MSLGDDLAAAEQRAREAVWSAFQAAYVAGGLGEVAGHQIGRQEHFAAALDRYGAVCRLAGRWEEHREWCKSGDLCLVDDVRAAKLARIMEGCG